MNKFDESFFIKYLPEDTTIHYVVHKHLISILGRIFIFMFLFVLLPSLFYYLSYALKDNIPFYYFESYLLITFAKVVYDIFDWYIDSWIITSEGIYDIKWKLFKTDVNSVNYENIEGIEIEQNGIIDKIFKKWNLVIHKVGSDVFRLDDVSNPYFAAEEIENNSEEEDHEDHDKDRFELMMETLSWVVNDYLERNGWIKPHHKHTEKHWHWDNHWKKHTPPHHEEINIEEAEWTIDLR